MIALQRGEKMMEKTSEGKILLSNDIKLNIEKLKSTLESYITSKDKKKKYRLIFEASYLIEKIIFYIQLEKGVSQVAVYRYTEEEKINPNPVTYLERIRGIDYHNEEFLEKLFAVREYIVNEYKRLKR